MSLKKKKKTEIILMSWTTCRKFYLTQGAWGVQKSLIYCSNPWGITKEAIWECPRHFRQFAPPCYDIVRHTAHLPEAVWKSSGVLLARESFSVKTEKRSSTTLCHPGAGKKCGMPVSTGRGTGGQSRRNRIAAGRWSFARSCVTLALELGTRYLDEFLIPQMTQRHFSLN